MRPLVSVVITAFNYGHMLATAIESVLRQNYDPIELLVLDNASTDDTAAVVARYAHDPRLRSIRNETNIGLIPNHNKGLHEARGDFIVFLSADDAMPPNALDRAIRYYDEHPDVDILFAGAYFMNLEGQITGVRQMNGQPYGAYAGGRNELAGLLAEGCYMCLPTMLVRRSIWEQYGGLDESMHAADWEISARWARAGLRFGYLTEALAIVRLHESQHSGQRMYVASGRDMRESLAIYDRYIDPEVPERYAGYEQAIRRLLEGKAFWFRRSYAEAADEFAPALAQLLLRIQAIAATNADRPRRRICYVVVAGTAIGAVEATLRSLVAQQEPGWSALVVQGPGHSFEPLCNLVDPTRIRHMHVIGHVAPAALLNTALRVEDADIYTIVRAGTVVGTNHAQELLAAYADPAARIVVTWPRFFVDPINPGAEPILIEELSAAPTGAFDILAGPQVPLEAISYAREVYDVLNGYNDTASTLADWEFLMRATLKTSDGLRMSRGGLDIHLTPATQLFAPTGPNIPALVESLYAAYPLTEPERQRSRADYLARLRAAGHFDITQQAGLRDFYRTLSRTGVSI